MRPVKRNASQRKSEELLMARQERLTTTNEALEEKAEQLQKQNIEVIPEDKQRIIVEAFQLADGTTSRKYGGTGLVLSISREIARLLGGEILVSSTPGQGSAFTLFVPRSFDTVAEAAAPPDTPAVAATSTALGTSPMPARLLPKRTETATLPVVASAPQEGLALLDMPSGDDDRERLRPGEPVVLIVEDDSTFASILLDLAREKGFRTILSSGGAAPSPSPSRRRQHAVHGPAAVEHAVLRLAGDHNLPPFRHLSALAGGGIPLYGFIRDPE